MRNSWFGKLLRLIGIILMSLTAAFTILGGAGTTCIALNPTGFGPKFTAIAPFQWLYILYVLVTVAIGVLGIRAVVLLVKGAKNAERYTLVNLVAGTLVGCLHIYTSRTLRGGSMPVDMVVYVTILTLLVFLLFRLPGLRQLVNYEKPKSEDDSGAKPAAIALGLSGLLTLTIQFIMAPTHTIGGINYADAWHISLSLVGAALVISGAGWLVREKLAKTRQVKLQVKTN